MAVDGYQVVGCSSYDCDGSGLAELERLVNLEIDKGWTPQGGVSVAVLSPPEGLVEYTYYQALVRLT